MAEELDKEIEASNELDVSAFVKQDEPLDKDKAINDNQKTDGQELNDNKELSWDDINTNSVDNYEDFGKDELDKENEKENTDENELNKQQQKSDEEKDNRTDDHTETKKITDDMFNVFRDELGLEAKSLPELKKQLEALEKENIELKSLKVNAIENDKIKNLTLYKNLDDAKLLMESYKRQGFSEQEAQNIIDRYTDNQMLDIEASKIRKGIENAIIKEKENQVVSNQSEEARLQKEREDSIVELKQHMEKVDTMFGLKIAKNETDLPTIRKEHVKYITSGSFLNEITESNQNLVEAGWLWKHREAITKQMYNKGTNDQRKEFMNELQQPDITNGSGRIKGPNDDDGFNVTKFIN